MSQHWATMKEAGALSGMRFMVTIYSFLGRRAFNIVLVPVMLYFLIRRREARQASLAFLQKVKTCYPEALTRGPLIWWSFQHFLSFGHSLLDKIFALSKPPASIEMSGSEEDLLYELVSTGQGALILGSHFGNLEYSRGISARHPSLIINVLIYDQHAEKFATLLSDAGETSNINLIQVTEIDINLALLLKDKVHNGEWIIIAADRVPVGGASRVCKADFFGEIASFPIGPYVLANLLHCPVYLLHCFHVVDHYRVRFELFEQEFKTDRKDRQQGFDQIAQRFASALEKQVAKRPLQWFNFFDFWNRHDQQRTE